VLFSVITVWVNIIFSRYYTYLNLNNATLDVFYIMWRVLLLIKTRTHPKHMCSLVRLTMLQ